VALGNSVHAYAKTSDAVAIFVKSETKLVSLRMAFGITLVNQGRFRREVVSAWSGIVPVPILESKILSEMDDASRKSVSAEDDTIKYILQIDMLSLTIMRTMGLLDANPEKLALLENLPSGRSACGGIEDVLWSSHTFAFKVATLRKDFHHQLKCISQYQ
jgi:hypothetical protein